MHKFILAENPQAPETGGLWIIHLPDPVAVIEVVALCEKAHTKNPAFKKQYTYAGPDGLENYQLRLHHYFSTDFAIEAKARTVVEKLLDEAWHWYAAYLKWEDKKLNNDRY